MRPHPPRHDDLFQRRIAGTLTDPVDGAFDLSGPGFDRGDHGTAQGLGDPPDAPPVALRRAREPRFDHVHPKRVQLAGETQLLLGRHRIAGRLLAVAQGRVEDDDVSPHGWLPCSLSRVDAEKKAADLLGSAALTASFFVSLAAHVPVSRAPQTLS